MVSYPITVPRLIYRGSNPARRRKVTDANLIAKALEEAINEVVAKQDRLRQSYDWYQFSQATGYTVDQIAEVGYAIDGGSNGFTVFRPQFPEF